MAYQSISPETQVKDSLAALLANDLSAHSAPDNYPTIRPSLLIDFANGKAIDPRINWGRDSAATYFDEFGVQRQAAPNTPRLDHDPITGECLGVLIEEQRTNLIPYSDDLTQSAWTKFNSSAVISEVLSPDGVTPMVKLIEDDSAGQNHAVNWRFTPAGNTSYVFGVMLKAGERRFARVTISNFAAQVASNTVQIDLQTGEYSCDDESRTMVKHLGGGIYYVATVVTTIADPTVVLVPQVLMATAIASGAHIYDGDGVSGIYVGGAQFEAAAWPSTRIYTNGSAATRAADFPIISSLDGLFTALEGTIVCDVATRDPSFATVMEFRTSSGTSSEQIRMLKWSTQRARYFYRANGTDLEKFASLTNYPLDGKPRKWACSYSVKTGDSAVAVQDGGSVANTGLITAAASNIAKLNLGCGGAVPNTFVLDGHMRMIAVYPKFLPLPTLEALIA